MEKKEILIKSNENIKIIENKIEILENKKSILEFNIEIDPLTEYNLLFQIESNNNYIIKIYNKLGEINYNKSHFNDEINYNFFSNHNIKLLLIIEFKNNNFFIIKKFSLYNKSFNNTFNNFIVKNISQFSPIINKLYFTIENKQINVIKESKLISILMSLYNTEDYVEEAIKSVINQTYKNWELLIIDDNSTDNSIERVIPFLVDKRIKLFSLNRNIGPFLTKNILLGMIKGEYISFIDSDDIYHKNKLNYQIMTLESNQKNIGIFNKFTRFKNNINNSIGEKKYETITSLLKKDILNDIGFFDTVKFGGDSEYKNRLKKFYGKQIIFDENILYYARVRDGSLTKIIPKVDDRRKLYENKFKKWSEITKKLFVPNYISINDDISRVIDGQYIKLVEGNLKDFIKKNLIEIKNFELNGIYIIHMKNSPKRIEKLIKQLKEKELNYKIYNAIDGRLLDINKMIESGKMDIDIKVLAENNRGSLGCYMSHLELWKKIYLEEKGENYLILEDDAILNENFNLIKLTKYLSYVPENYNLVYLGSSKIKGEMINKYVAKPDVGNFKGYNSGMYGYLIKRNTILNLIKLLDHIIYPIKDPFIRINFDIIKAYFILDKLISHNNEFESDRLKRDDNRGKNPGIILEQKKLLLNKILEKNNIL
jgi:glycosyltransferase involved in cell wall biosynthesis